MHSLISILHPSDQRRGKDYISMVCNWCHNLPKHLGIYIIFVFYVNHVYFLFLLHRYSIFLVAFLMKYFLTKCILPSSDTICTPYLCMFYFQFQFLVSVFSLLVLFLCVDHHHHLYYRILYVLIFL